jgi:hypothetical protein
MTDTSGFVVRVIDRAPADGPVVPTGPLMSPDGLSEEAVAFGMGLALLTGLVDNLEVRRGVDGVGTEVRMIWQPR